MRRSKGFGLSRKNMSHTYLVVCVPVLVSNNLDDHAVRRHRTSVRVRVHVCVCVFFSTWQSELAGQVGRAV